MGQFPLEQWFFEMPVCTRWWMTAALSASVLVQCRIINPFQLFYSFRTVFFKSQVSLDEGTMPWILLTETLVLETGNNVSLLWAPQPRSSLPHLLPPALLPSPRGVLWPLTRPLLMAPHVRFYTSPLHGAYTFHGFLRHCAVEHVDLYLEQEEPGHNA